MHGGRSRDLGGLGFAVVDGLRGDLRLHDLHIGSEERESGQRSGANRETFTRSRGRVSERIEHIGAFAHEWFLSGHLGVTAGIIRDRTISIGGERDTESREHTDSGDADSVKTHEEALSATGEEKCAHDGDRGREQGGPRGFHSLGDTGDDHSSRSR